MDETPEYLTALQVATRLGIEEHMLESLVEDGILPTAHRIGKKKFYWHVSDVVPMAWLLGNHQRLKGMATPLTPPSKKAEPKE